MLRRRYPYGDVGRLAAAVFAAASLIVGVVVGLRTYGGSAAVTDAVLYAAIGGVVALLVFSSEGPRRPASIVQAVAADGVVTGILAGFFFALAQVVAASGNASPPSTGQDILALVLSAIAGGVIGGLVGLLIYAGAGGERLSRVRVSRSERRKRTATSGKKRRR